MKYSTENICSFIVSCYATINVLQSTMEIETGVAGGINSYYIMLEDTFNFTSCRKGA